jgi:hypothetical protein
MLRSYQQLLFSCSNDRPCQTVQDGQVLLLLSAEWRQTVYSIWVVPGPWKPCEENLSHSETEESPTLLTPITLRGNCLINSARICWKLTGGILQILKQAIAQGKTGLHLRELRDQKIKTDTSAQPRYLHCTVHFECNSIEFYIWVSVHRKSIIYNKPSRSNSGSIVFIKNYKYALHVSDVLCVHLQEHYKL